MSGHSPVSLTPWLTGFLPVDARALFERVVNIFPADRARPIWDRWARYEYQFGSLEASQALEKRIAEVYPNGMYCDCLIVVITLITAQTRLLSDSQNDTNTWVLTLSQCMI